MQVYCRIKRSNPEFGCKPSTAKRSRPRVDRRRLVRSSDAASVDSPSGAALSEWRVYPANLCPLSSGVEFARLGEDFGQSVGEPIKAVPGRAVWQGSPEHFNGVLSEQ